MNKGVVSVAVWGTQNQLEDPGADKNFKVLQVHLNSTKEYEASLWPAIYFYDVVACETRGPDSDQTG